MDTTSFLIIGAGISGLTTAWRLREHGHSVTLLEARDEVGGNLRSLQRDGWLIERGPNSTLDNRPALGELTRALGLEPLEANAQAKRRYVLRDGRLHALPGSPGGFIKTPLFSARGKWRLLAEPFFARASKEESVAEFVERRLGREFLDWAINPFVSGVYAGDPDRLSVRAATAKVYALERDHRSLLLGALNRMLFHKHRGGAGPAGTLISFAEGMQQLPRTLSRALAGAIHTDIPVDRLSHEAGRWSAWAQGQSWSAEQVVLCLPAYECARLLGPLVPEVEAELAPIPYPPVFSVSLGYRRDQIRHPLDGFGFLIPRCTGVETLGALFPSTLFPNRAPEGHCLITAFIGGRLNEGIAQCDEAEVVARVRRDLSPLLGISGEPVIQTCTAWPQAIPQYELGHLERVEAVDRALERWPGLHLRANWRDGISVGDCVQNAWEFAERFTAG